MTASPSRRRAARLVFGAVLTVVIAAAVHSYTDGGLVHELLRSDLPAAEKVDRIRAFVLGFGRASALVYLLTVIAEVVIAPIPGALLYAPGGMLFGGFWGGVLTLLGNTIGAGLACQITRTLAARRVAAWTEQPRLRRLRETIEGKGFWVVLLLRLNPLTSSDLVSYAAGLTSIPTWQVMAGTLIGMAPLCFLQAHFAHRLIEDIPALLYPAIGLCVLYVAICAWLLLRSTKGDAHEPLAQDG